MQKTLQTKTLSTQVFMDNGGGMTPDTLHKMLGFGHSDKKEIDGHR